jgi:hypothetical protein
MSLGQPRLRRSSPFSTDVLMYERGSPSLKVTGLPSGCCRRAMSTTKLT